ncbi:hypothetical protein P9850_12835 [Anoxybacillus rupiensis]|uniref:Transcriptional regulator n=1 Tax=Anoxybacteroides rupiense TaxID=311460 RepID=A0ABD5IZA6_9BACL|nr:hypothetical protein [Anoxybacillus rupiensis]
MEDEQNQLTDIEQPKRLDLMWLALGKRVGLSFAEMNELGLSDLRDLIDAYVDSFSDKSKIKARMATQADIDDFFA